MSQFPDTESEQPVYRPATAPGTSSLAILALVCGLIGFCMPIFIPAILGVVLGIIAINKIDASEGRMGGRGLAQAGAITGGIALAFNFVGIFMMIGILLPALGAARKTANQMKNSSQIRAQYQGSVIYGQSNATFLPGLDSTGAPLAAGTTTTGSATDDGTVAGARYWVLLHGSFIIPQLLLNPVDNHVLWTAGPVTQENHSYAMSRITSPVADKGRLAEWKDNSNGAAVMISDRNTGSDNTDAGVQSLWVAGPGNWRGSVCWGDNHVSFELTSVLYTTTIYNAVGQSQDNLFATQATNGVTEAGADPASNAFMTVGN